MLKYKGRISVAEPEERRMSDLSDWGSSATSSVDIQVIQYHEATSTLNVIEVLVSHEMTNMFYSRTSYLRSFSHFSLWGAVTVLA